MLTKESCPFIYSYDGTSYIFDGEPYGGAICEGLKRTDWCELSNLAPVNGSYRIRLTNEVDETQYTDQLSLLMVDHPDSVAVAYDNHGAIHTIKHPIPPTSASDLCGTDILAFIKNDDHAFWYDDPLKIASYDSTATRNELRFSFPKPSGRTAKILLNASTTLWGSYMIKQFLELAGSGAGAWYKDQERKSGDTIHESTWMDRAELYRVRVFVETDTGWASREVFQGGGPFVSENRIYTIDISDVSTDSLTIRLSPPVGFWQINYIAVDYSEDLPVATRELFASTAVAHTGEDLVPVFAAIDRSYHTMPEIGDAAEISFPAPPPVVGARRTIFAKVNGYYDIHLTTTKKIPAFSTLKSFRKDPEAAIRYSTARFRHWKESLRRQESRQ